MNLGMNMIFWIWLGTHKYIYMIQSIHMDVVRHKGACLNYCPILNLQYVKTKLSYDADFFACG